MSLSAAPYISLSQLPPLHPITSLSASKKKTLAASQALQFLQSLPLQLDLLVDPSSSVNPYFGVLITDVEPHSSVYHAGLRPGDVLLEVNGVATVAVEDVSRALQGCIAGDEVSVTVERGAEELTTRVMLGGAGVSLAEVRAAYRLLMEEVRTQQALQALPSPPLSSSHLALCDLLDTPQFAHSLLSFMDASKCGECVGFLQAEAAYQRIPRTESLRLMKAAHALYDSFVAEDAPQMVNIDSALRRDLQAAMSEGDFPSTLFHPIAKAVYQLTETDVLPRYFQSSAFASLTQPGGWQALNDCSIGRGRRRSNSFSCVPMEERRVELEDVRTAFQCESSDDIGTHRKALTKYKDSFKGSSLLRWLLKVKVCESEAAAAAMGQRLMDAFLLWRCDDADEDTKGDFTADDTLYSLQPPESIDSAVDEDSCDSAFVLVKGVHYTRLWLKVHRKKRKVSLHRDQFSTQTLFKASLRHATVTLHSRQCSSSSPSLSASDSSSASSSLNRSPYFLAVPSPTATPPRSSSRAVAPATPPPSPLSIDALSGVVTSACYLHFALRDSHAPRSELVLRVDDEKEARGWTQLLNELGVSVKGL